MAYLVIAKKSGSARDLRLFHSFGLSNSSEEAIERVQKRYLRDVHFREKWRGWVFGVLLADTFFSISQDGASILHLNQKVDIYR